MELIDTHCHLVFDEFAGALEGVLSRSRAAGATGWIAVGTEPAENQKAIALAGQYENMYAAVGFHPHIAKDVTASDLEQLKQAAQNDKVVAIGEMGLDFYYDNSPRDAQTQLFREELKIAAELSLPVLIHSREAFEQTLAVLDEFEGRLKKVVFHCFSYSAEQAKIILDRGWHISFTGVVTFKNAQRVRQAAKSVPLDRLMLETDCPYMSPEPMRKQKINEPALLVHTARFLAELKGMDFENFCDAVTATSKAFFNLP